MKVLDIIFHLAILILGISIPSATFVVAFSAPASSSLQSLLSTHQSSISSLKDAAATISKNNEDAAPNNDVFYLRYVLNDSYDDDEQRLAALTSNLEWRMNEGNGIVVSARGAIRAAMLDTGKWNNEPIRTGAPHAALINEFLTSTQVITTSLAPSTSDLVYCIRAGKIDDKALMAAVTVEQMVDFFLYVKEVNAVVADLRSIEADTLIKIVTCQDMKGVKLIGGSKDFQKSLSAASKKANELYPSLNGRTLILNIPSLLGPLVKVFKLFLPKAVTQRIRFVNGPLKDVEDLREIAEGGRGRDEFVNQVNVLAYGE